MADGNLSNGTCYYAQHSVTSGDFVPCGNIALGNWPCCHTGDVCLAFATANACYDYESGNTYVAGCTDADYVDSTCPQKLGFAKQEWVAIHHCDTTPSGDTEWGGCLNVPENDTALTKIPNSRCDPYCTLSVPLWVGASSIEAYATVPSSAGGAVAWTNDFNPATTSRITGTPAATTTPTPTPTTTATQTRAPTSPSPTSIPDPGDSGLDTGAKVGIGIGSLGAAALIVAVLLLALLVRRRWKKRQEARGEPPAPGGVGLPPGAKHDTDGHGLGRRPQRSTDGGGPYTGFKSELPADSQGQPMGSPQQTSASPHSPDHMSVSNASTLLPGRNGSLGYVTPQSTGPEGHAGRHHGRGEWGSVSEMQG